MNEFEFGNLLLSRCSTFFGLIVTIYFGTTQTLIALDLCINPYVLAFLLVERGVVLVNLHSKLIHSSKDIVAKLMEIWHPG